MKLFSKISLQLIVFLLLSHNIVAQNIPAPMSPPRLVNDFANVFSEAERQALENKLLTYNDTTSTQIYVITVNDLDGYAVSDYAFKIGEKWEVGQKGKDNGAVILIKPKIGNSRGQAYISIGYGLEGSIPDGYAGRIVRERMIPSFDDGDYFSGVNAAIDSMIKRLEGEFDPEMKKEEGIPLSTIIIFTILFIIFITIISKKGDQNIDSDGSSRSGPVFFPPIVGSGRRGSFGSGGGFGGGGFGGGGGGRFGGGGAGGSW